MLTSKQYALLAGVIFLLVLVAGIWYVSQPQINPSLAQRLAECGSLPNGSAQAVVETTRMFINIPKDLYPDVNLQTTSHGATAGYISNGGPYGSAIGGQGKPNCWSYYFEFDGTGTVDLTSRSGMSGVPDYLIHFIVSASTSTQPKACPQIAKECPDGSYVGPTGPNCTFVCPSSTTSTSTTPNIQQLNAPGNVLLQQGGIAEIRNKSFYFTLQSLSSSLATIQITPVGCWNSFPSDSPPQIRCMIATVLIPPQTLYVGQTYSAANYGVTLTQISNGTATFLVSASSRGQ
jgi:hypothetical protein